ncbi:cytoplasmic heat shock protein 70 [Histomonas meleagridis]|uniref:cytoplasmic heat shock protein 70 n=1 Tax=Histomonas meleagridis TaxID=135588 RepID=UPI003559A4F6|nr:cytoplasmic heat shock protein 70 [Histomonas meleagridis]KAH0803744.1 cytoplasmic heat shock protein 70 [Histomonas meleagridis]
MRKKTNSEKKPILGFDFGTTYNSVSVWRNGHVDIINNNLGNYSTPSYVTIQKDSIIVGDVAKNIATDYPDCTIFDSKRLIGRTYHDPCVQSDLMHWPFNVVCDQRGMPFYEIRLDNEIRKYSAIEIASYIFDHMKKIADHFLGLDSDCSEGINDDAVVTVPAYFNAVQRAAIMEAARRANLNVLRIIDEPTAAAIAYGLNEKSETARKLLIFDFGGGTLDLSLLENYQQSFTVLAVGGDTHLGGQDIDNLLVDYFATRFEKEHECNIRGDKRAMFMIRVACEKAKITLSTTNIARISCPSLYNGKDYSDTITRAEFEDLIYELLQNILKPIDDVFNQANERKDEKDKIYKKDIDAVVLIGGTSKIPLVGMMLEEIFPNKILKTKIDPE